MCECNNEKQYKTFINCGNVILRISDISMVTLDSKIIHVIDTKGLSQDILFKSKKSAEEAFDFLLEDLGIL